MKKLNFLILIVSFFFAYNVKAANNNTEEGGLEWFTSLDLAHEASVKRNLPIFGFFTGSDWCGWCIQLQKNVFVKQAFIDWAKDNVILLELDFPKKKQLSQEQRIQNQNLQQALGVAGYPTIWIFKTSKDAATGNFSLTKYGKLGYPSGAVRGQEEVKFLADAEAVLLPFKAEVAADKKVDEGQKVSKEKSEEKTPKSEVAPELKKQDKKDAKKKAKGLKKTEKNQLENDKSSN